MEFDLSPSVAERENMSMEQLIGRAQGLWEGATRFEYDRALRAEADGHSNTIGDEQAGGGGAADDDNNGDNDDDGPVVFPYILCSKDNVGEADKVAQWAGTGSTGGTGQQQTLAVQRKKSGFDRKLLIQEAIANATSQSELYRDGAGGAGFDGSAVVLKDMFNGRGAYCAVASLPGSIAMALEFDGCVVQPMMLATKLGAGTVTLAVAIVNKFENSTKIDMDVPDDLEELIEEQVHAPGSGSGSGSTSAGEEDVVPTERKFPGVTVSLCPGFLSADDVFNLQSGRPVKQKKVQRIMTEWLLSKTADGEDTTDRIKQNLYWTSSSRDSASTATDRGKFWGDIMDRVSEPNACAQTFKKRLTWYLEPGLSETSFMNLHVTYDNLGASKTDHDCILAAIAGFSIHPDICFFEFDLEKTPQIEYQQHLRSSQHRHHHQHIQRRRERATHRPNADWMVQSYVEQARPFFDAGINGTGVVVAVSDTGLDSDNCYFHDAINPIGMNHRKIVSYDVAKGDGSDYEGGHGTVSNSCMIYPL